MFTPLDTSLNGNYGEKKEKMESTPRINRLDPHYTLMKYQHHCRFGSQSSKYNEKSINSSKFKRSESIFSEWVCEITAKTSEKKKLRRTKVNKIKWTREVDKHLT